MWTVALTALGVGTTAAVSYYFRDPTLSHYDAKAHLVVARRIVDSMQPGWMQIGAVWLPLPHLLNLIPVQVDAFYKTGLSAVVCSVAGFVLGATALWAVVVGQRDHHWRHGQRSPCSPRILTSSIFKPHP
jgi:hypothetical protein